MTWQYNPYAPPLLLTAAITGALALIAWQRRSVPGALPVALLMLGVLVWSLAYALELVSATLDTKLFWAKVQYAGFVPLPLLWLTFSLVYTGREDRLTRRSLILLAIIPLLTLALAWTNELHGLIYQAASLDTSQGFAMLSLDHGPAFWLQGAYAYMILFIATFLILRAFLESPRPLRTQAAILLVGALVPLIANMLYVYRLGTLHTLDPTPFAFAITGLLAIWAVFRYRFLELAPVARDALVEDMSDGVVVLDPQDRIVDLNAAAHEILGRQRSQAIGKPAGEIIAGWNELRTRLAEPIPHTEVTIPTVSGNRTFDLRFTTLHDRHGEPTGRLLVWRDISDRKTAEEAEREQRALAEALRYATSALTSTLSLDEVLDRILEEVGTVVPHDTIAIMLNEHDVARVVRSRGFEKRGLGQWIQALRLPIAGTPNLRRMQETKAPLAIAKVDEYADWITMPNQEWLRSFAGAPIRSQDAVIGFLSLTSTEPGFYNATLANRLQAFADQAGIAIENARLVTSLQAANAELQAAIRSRDEMFQNVSHELRTPLTLLSGYVEIMQRASLGEVSQAQAEALEVMSRQTERLQAMVDNLLTLQGLDRLSLQPLPMAFSPWLAEAVQRWQLRAQGASMQILVDIQPELPPVLIDDRHLQQVIDNLLDNAVKFSPAGGQIRVCAHTEDHTVLLAVSDQGIGIAQDQLSMIFQRFYQVDGSLTRQYGGIGIGLSLCQAIVEAHHGRIWAESTGPGQGTTFYIELPAMD